MGFVSDLMLNSYFVLGLKGDLIYLMLNSHFVLGLKGDLTFNICLLVNQPSKHSSVDVLVACY